MSSNDQNKSLGISTIPLSKLTIVMNNFILNTINHLNKISVKGDEKLQEFDEKLNDLEIMTTLLESKLNSLPQNITSTYPEIQQCNLDDLSPNITITSPTIQTTQQTNTISTSAPSGGPIPPPPPPMVSSAEQEKIVANAPKVDVNNPQEDQKVSGGDGGELSPMEELDKFLEENDDYKNLLKMLKLGVPTSGVRQKVVMNGMDEDIFNQLLELAHKAYPKISLN